MPNAKNNLKLTGDTHLPETESDDFRTEGAHPEGTGTEGTQPRRRDKDDVGSAPRGGRHAGEIRDRDNPTSGHAGRTRDSGER